MCQSRGQAPAEFGLDLPQHPQPGANHGIARRNQWAPIGPRYTDEVVNDTVLRELIGLAVQAPSAVNQQPWSFVVIKDRVLLTHISDRAKVHMLKSPLAASASHYHDTLSDPNFQIFYHAPVLIVICAVDAGDWGVEDCALAAENLMLQPTPKASEPADRLRTKLAHHPRRQVGPRAATRLYPRGAHYSRPPTLSIRACPSQNTRHSLARSLSTQIPTYAYRRLKPLARNHAARRTSKWSRRGRPCLVATSTLSQANKGRAIGASESRAWFARGRASALQ